MTELEKKSQEYADKKLNKLVYCSCCQNPDVKQAYKDGYKQGQKDTFQTYNSEVNEMSNDYSYRLEQLKKENEELKEKLKGFENGEVAWQGDMDMTIKQNLELKAELEEKTNFYNKQGLELIVKIEKMKCCGNCKWKGQYQIRSHCIECAKEENSGWELK